MRCGSSFLTPNEPEEFVSAVPPRLSNSGTVQLGQEERKDGEAVL